jgi:phosphopentomutase
MAGTVERFIIVVLDSVGAGAMPDAAAYGDAGADTLGHIFAALGPGFTMPNLAALGIYDIVKSPLHAPPACAAGAFGTMACASPAKDTTAGHWELAGLVLPRPFPTYPHGFPAELIAEFERRIGTKTLGNVPASGTEIIRRLGEEHCRTGYPIVYTSVDSVFQIAAHETVFGLERLYAACRTARALLIGPHAVGRVIARPFTGGPGGFVRTENRRDFGVDPFAPTILDDVTAAGGTVIGIGKISDIFNGRGLTRAVTAHGNEAAMAATIAAVRQPAGPRTVVFTNLVDFDMLWGHRRDTAAYGRGLMAFDRELPELQAALRDGDVLIITADHGCDPTFGAHTDHTREYVPLLVSGGPVAPGARLGVRATFADVAQTIADAFGLGPRERGTSFMREMSVQP